MKIYLDTNFLIYLIENKLFHNFQDFLSENFKNYEIYIFLTTLAEIGNINKKILKIVKLLIRKNIIKVDERKGKIDELLKEVSKDSIIATEDENLKDFLKENKRKFIEIRGKHFYLFQ